MSVIDEKFVRYKEYALYGKLTPEQQDTVRQLTFDLRLTFQEFRQVVEICRDLDMWGEEGLDVWWLSFMRMNGQYADVRTRKTQFLSLLRQHITELKEQARSYDALPGIKPQKPEKTRVVAEPSEKKVFGWCPVASERTVCCNLRTIDAVESCAYGCSYCTIQTFYRDRIVIDTNLAGKLKQLSLDDTRRYHIGTGQSSDSLVWGNRNGMLDDLTAFAGSHPNVLLEFKTKSANVDYFLQNEAPPNIVCSWSLNPQIIIDHEEHYTAGLEQRLDAARRVADRGIKVSFHFHPIIYYDRWDRDYPQIVRMVTERFDPEEVLFISFGSVTFIKPVIKKIRERGLPTKILQMDFVTDPHGKLTYADHIKTEKFRLMYQTFHPWHEKVFFYLCMEKASLWEQSLGFVYDSNDAFEQALLDSSFAKIEGQNGT